MSIDLLDEVNTFHQTKVNDKRYVHHDIKPDNILVDQNGKLHLIDFGLTEPTMEQTVREDIKQGTEGYSPCDLDTTETKYPFIKSSSLTTPHEADTIATVRCIYHPSFDKDYPNSYTNGCLLSKTEYFNLPLALKTMLNTENIKKFIAQGLDENAIKAALIIYQLTNQFTFRHLEAIKIPENQAKLFTLFKKKQNPNETNEEALATIEQTIKMPLEPTTTVDELEKLQKYLSEQIGRIGNNPGWLNNKKKTEQKLSEFNEQYTLIAYYKLNPQSFTQSQIEKLKSEIQETASIKRGLLKSKSLDSFSKAFKDSPNSQQSIRPALTLEVQPNTRKDTAALKSAEVKQAYSNKCCNNSNQTKTNNLTNNSPGNPSNRPKQ